MMTEPYRGRVECPSVNGSKFVGLIKKLSYRSELARKRRKDKRKLYNKNCKEKFKLLKSSLKNNGLDKLEIKRTLRAIRKERKPGYRLERENRSTLHCNDKQGEEIIISGSVVIDNTILLKCEQSVSVCEKMDRVVVENLDNGVNVIVEWEDGKYCGILSPVVVIHDKFGETYKEFEESYNNMKPKFKIDYEDGAISFVKLLKKGAKIGKSVVNRLRILEALDQGRFALQDEGGDYHIYDRFKYKVKNISRSSSSTISFKSISSRVVDEEIIVEKINFDDVDWKNKMNLSARISVDWIVGDVNGLEESKCYYGLLCQVNSHDKKGNVYEGFVEQHKSEPEYKLNYDDGTISFVKLDFPSIANRMYEGILIDEGGDEHRYVRVRAPFCDKDENPRSVIGPKNAINITTFNMRSGASEARLARLIEVAIDSKSKVLCVQEHKIIIKSDDLVIYKNMGDGWIFIYSSATLGVNGHGVVGGVGILLHSSIYNRLKKVTSINSRIILADFDTELHSVTQSKQAPNTVIICCYAPTNGDDEKIRVDFFKKLDETVNNVPNHSFLICAGDLNARLGKNDKHVSALLDFPNENGTLLQEMIDSSDLVSLLCDFKHRRSKTWTFMGKTRNKNTWFAQLDHILVRKKWRNSVIDISVMDNVGFYSDHRPVTVSVKLSLRKKKTEKKVRTRKDWSLFMDDKVAQLEVLATMRECLYDNETLKLKDFCYVEFLDASDKAHESIPDCDPRIKRIYPWNNSLLNEQRRKLRNSDFSSQMKKVEFLKLNEADLECKKAYMANCLDQVKEASDNCKTKVVYKIIKQISGHSAGPKGRISANNTKQRIDGWANYFKSLLNVEIIVKAEDLIDGKDVWMPKLINAIDLEIFSGDTNLLELQVVLNSMKSGKAVGLDDVSTEFLKIPGILEYIVPLVNKVLSSGVAFEEWTKNIIIPIPKKGDLSDYNNYRGISLMSIVGKLYNKLLLARVQPLVSTLLRGNQNGFRGNRGTSELILAMRRLLEILTKKNSTGGIFTFIDFKKAFDSINRSRMIKILRAYGVPIKVISQINAMYVDTTSAVKSEDGTSDFF